MPFIVLSLLLQIALVVHVMKTGRNTTWIWIIVILPGAGSIAYVLLEVLPELLGSRFARKATRGVGQIVNPNRDINAAAHDYSLSKTVDNSLRLAEECMTKGMYQEARDLYQQSLSGIHEHDPYIMHGLARAEFMLGNFERSKKLLDELIRSNPDFKNQDAHLLYARVVEQLGDLEQALEEYEVLAGYYSGAEARYRYAMLLRQCNEHDKSKAHLIEIVQLSKTSGKHYWSLNKKWITLAKKALSD